MAALRHVLRRSRSNVSTLVNVLSQTELSLTYQGRRFLFSKDFLGLDNYERQRLVTSDRLGDVKHKFCERMESYMKGDNPGTVFTDDMKTMLHIAETEAEYDIVEKMYRRYVQQDSDLPVNEFMFGPVVLRLLYYMNKADTAYKLFTDEEFDGKFDSMTSFVLILDQLYEQGDYKKVLDVFEMIQQKNIRGIKYPNDSTTIALAACYKLNTEESFHTMLGVFKGCRERGIYLTPRSTSFAAMLALNQNRPDVAMEILVSRNEERILTSMNLKAIAYSRIGRLDDAMRLLKNILTRDLPEQYRRGNEVFRDTIKELEAAVQNSGNPGEMSRELQTVVQRLANGGHISDKSLDEFICQPILRQRTLQTSFKSRQRSVPQYQAYRREGLTDMN